MPTKMPIKVNVVIWHAMLDRSAKQKDVILQIYQRLVVFRKRSPPNFPENKQQWYLAIRTDGAMLPPKQQRGIPAMGS